MKKLFLYLFALLTATVSFAQNTLVATLSHGENVQVFYGSKALEDAHNAAENGDIITLSSGNFSIASITKAVTIRGAGMYDSEDKSIKATTISGGSFGVRFNIPKDLSQQLIVEGVYFRQYVGWEYLENAIFRKCRFYYLGGSDKTDSSVNLTFVHCISELGGDTRMRGSFTIVNSYVRLSYTSGGTFINCYINAGSGGSTKQYCFLTNCVIIGQMTDSSNTLDHCISNYSFSNAPATDCTQVSGLTMGLNSKFPDYLGNDGTEVGIYGGAMPFSPTPTYPQITKCNVSSKSTVDGKISVDIEVNTVE